MVGDGSWLSFAAGLWLPPKSQPRLLKFYKYSPAITLFITNTVSAANTNNHLT